MRRWPRTLWVRRAPGGYQVIGREEYGFLTEEELNENFKKAHCRVSRVRTRWLLHSGRCPVLPLRPWRIRYATDKIFVGGK